jgi:hypothetical protein
MARRSFRIAAVLAGVIATAALGYRAFVDEQAIARTQVDGARHERAAEDALVALADLRATLHAYVAPGQGLLFWSKRSAALLDAAREHLIALDAALARFGGSVAGSLDGIDQLTTTEARARVYAARGEPLLAGDVIFAEARELFTAADEDVRKARTALGREYSRRAAALRREQAALAGGALVLWMIIALVLVPVSAPAAALDPGEWRHQLADRLKKPEDLPLKHEPAEPAEPAEPVEPTEPVLTASALRAVGEICADLSALSDVGALSGALERAADALGASGVIVWIASNDGGKLAPVATHGFDPRLVARIGAISRDSANLTAAAFRENAARVSAPEGSTPAALAVSMCGPSGPLGVLSVEFRDGTSADEASIALATIFAAQLATLAFPIAPAAAAAAPEVEGARRAAL